MSRLSVLQRPPVVLKRRFHRSDASLISCIYNVSNVDLDLFLCKPLPFQSGKNKRSLVTRVFFLFLFRNAIHPSQPDVCATRSCRLPRRRAKEAIMGQAAPRDACLGIAILVKWFIR